MQVAQHGRRRQWHAIPSPRGVRPTAARADALVAVHGSRFAGHTSLSQSGILPRRPAARRR